jgi:hypothetical protein
MPDFIAKLGFNTPAAFGVVKIELRIGSWET